MTETALHVEQARAEIRSAMAPVAGIECLALAAARHRALHADLVSPINVPAADNSAMDGYALRRTDVDSTGVTELRIVGEALAGTPWVGRIAVAECVRIMTGALLPDGADCVVPQEVVQRNDDRIMVSPGLHAGQHVRRAGEDLALGATALRAGAALGPAELGLVASLGIATLEVRRRLRVAFLSTGSEIAQPGESLRPGQVYDSNRQVLAALLDEPWVERIDLGSVRDDPDAIEHALFRAAHEVDAIITTGGVSVGDADHLRGVVSRLGEVQFWSLAIRPGRPMAFGRIGSAIYFGLPGNPVAALVAFLQFVREALEHMAGLLARPSATRLNARCESALGKRPGRTEYQRGLYQVDMSGRLTVRSSGDQGSGVLRSMVEANCFIVLEHERGAVAADESVTIEPFGRRL